MNNAQWWVAAFGFYTLEDALEFGRFRSLRQRDPVVVYEGSRVVCAFQNGVNMCGEQLALFAS